MPPAQQANAEDIDRAGSSVDVSDGAAEAQKDNSSPPMTDEEILAYFQSQRADPNECLSFDELARKRELKLKDQSANTLLTPPGALELIQKLGSALAVTTQALESGISGGVTPSAQQQGDGSSASSRPLRVAITLMTRAPHRFDWWLRYHRSLGVCHVFVHVEATPELLPLLASEEFAGFVTVTSTSTGDAGTGTGAGDGTGTGPSLGTSGLGNGASSATGGTGVDGELANNYHTLMERQESQVRSSMQKARAMGIDWLFHIDDDELLHLDVPFAELVRGLDPTVTCLVLVNIEAVPSGELSPHCVFTSTDTFTLHRMQAYRNGKAAGNLRAKTGWKGPHRFAGTDHVVPLAQACLLHFESASYDMWKSKFLRHSKGTGATQRNEIPFELYRDSIELFQRDPTGGVDEARWKAFFLERKVGHFEGLAENQKKRIALSSADPPRMV